MSTLKYGEEYGTGKTAFFNRTKAIGLAVVMKLIILSLKNDNKINLFGINAVMSHCPKFSFERKHYF